MRIVFFNHYHNGDVFASKGYVADLINEFKGHEIIYQHFNSPKLLRDLNIDFMNLEIPLGSFNDRTRITSERNSIYVNTWIGNYLTLDTGINWNTYHLMFKKIYQDIAENIDRTIELRPINYYFPHINYEYFDVPEINVPKGSIIISNGPVLSGQSDLINLDNLIIKLLEHTDRSIILTHFSPIHSDRIAFTNNLINTSGGDLNEIAWISEQCEYIIGRNSGPFCFMTNKNNINDSNKKIISIGNNDKDSFMYNIPTKCNYKFVHDNDVDEILRIVS